MSKRVTKGQEAQSETYRANLARLERNRQRREQRAKRKAKMTPAPEPTPDKTAEQTPEGVGVGSGGAAMGGAGAFPSGTNECAPGEPVGHDGVVYGRPRYDPDLRIGRRSPHMFDGRRVYDVSIVRATDNARTVVRGLREEAAEKLMNDVVYAFGSDLVSVERVSRIEY